MSTKISVTGNAGALSGTTRIPGDKSISHRAVMFSSMGRGKSRVRGFLDGGDCRSTIDVIRGLGVKVDRVSETELLVHGNGTEAGGSGWVEPIDVLDCGNSGTTMRLITGLLAPQPFTSFLVGTPQLQGRPMGRVADPLRRMGARIIGRGDGKYAPLGIYGCADGNTLKGMTYEMPVASAQVKSCVLLAGLFAEGATTVVEPGPCRDHTERMLKSMGAPIIVDGPKVTVTPLDRGLAPLDVVVPGDPSSAAFLLVAGSVVPGSKITLEGVCVNPTRTGIIAALRRLGASIEFENERDEGGEPVADLTIEATALEGATIGGLEIVTLIDEIPVLAVAATQAKGETIIKDAQELRVKETDRIETTASELRKLGAQIETTPDGMIISGPTPLTGAEVTSHGDHRTAMAMTIAGLIANGTTLIHEAEVTGDSFPGFEQTLQKLGAELEVTK